MEVESLVLHVESRAVLCSFLWLVEGAGPAGWLVLPSSSHNNNKHPDTQAGRGPGQDQDQGDLTRIMIPAREGRKCNVGNDLKRITPE